MGGGRRLRRIRPVVASFVFLCAVSARASEPEPDKVARHAEEPTFIRHALQGNLAVAPLGRYGLSFEWLPIPHHALVLSAYRQTPGLASMINGGLLGLGGEVGWRVYSSARGPMGLFVGPSVLGAFHTSDNTDWFGSFGGAVDAGYGFQFRRPRFFHVTFASGAQFLMAGVERGDLARGARLLVGPGFAPRMQLAAGMAW
jgi:hypothetical protein